MDKDFLKHNLQIIASNAIGLQHNITQLSIIENELNSVRQHFTEQTNAIKFAVCSAIGLFKFDDVKTDNIFANYLQTSQQNLISSGLDNQTILEELKKMIINLNIKGSIRIRDNGLIEFRNKDFGSIYGRTNAEIEQKIVKKIKEEKKNKNTENKKTILLSEFFQNQYLPYKKANLAEKSIKDIKSSFKNFAKFDKALNKYTVAEIEKFLYSIPQTRKRQILQGLLNNIMNYAKRLGYIKVNPCDNVEKMKHTKKVGQAMSFKDQKAFFKALYLPTSPASEIEKLYLTFVYLTGTRCNEALSIKKNDIMFDSNILHIPSTKTKMSDRNMPMFALVKKLLKLIDIKQDKIFNLKNDTASKSIHKITDKYHLHELRHTFGTIAICVQKLDPKTVSLYMGHSSPITTLNIYTHPEQLDEELFFDGSLSDSEKVAKLQAEYNNILQIIADYLDYRTQNIPKK